MEAKLYNLILLHYEFQHVKRAIKQIVLDWLLDWIVFDVVSTIFQPYNQQNCLVYQLNGHEGKAKLIRPTCLLFSFNEIFPKRFESKVSYSDTKLYIVKWKVEVSEHFLKYQFKY